MHIRDADPADAAAVTALAREAGHAAYGEFLRSDAIDATIDDWYARGFEAVGERTTTVDGTGCEEVIVAVDPAELPEA